MIKGFDCATMSGLYAKVLGVVLVFWKAKLGIDYTKYQKLLYRELVFILLIANIQVSFGSSHDNILFILCFKLDQQGQVAISHSE